MKVWKYLATEYVDDSDTLSSQGFEGGHVVADSFEEAYSKVKKHIEEAWGNEIRLEITELSFDHTIQIP